MTNVELDADFRVVTPIFFERSAFQSSAAVHLPTVTAHGAGRNHQFSGGGAHWADRSPIGARVRLADLPWMTVIGVVADVRYEALDEPGDAVRPIIYVPPPVNAGGRPRYRAETVPSPATLRSLPCCPSHT